MIILLYKKTGSVWNCPFNRNCLTYIESFHPRQRDNDTKMQSEVSGVKKKLCGKWTIKEDDSG